MPTIYAYQGPWFISTNGETLSVLNETTEDLCHAILDSGQWDMIVEWSPTEPPKSVIDRAQQVAREGVRSTGVKVERN